MVNRNIVFWLYLYLLAGIVDLILTANHLGEYRIVSKPLIILSLIVFFIKSSLLIRGSFLRKSICSALVFSLLGDMLMLNPGLYLYGLGAYFIMHLCYILSFMLAQKPGFQLSRFYFIKLFVYNSPVYLLAGFLYFLIHNQLFPIKLPIIIHLCGMVLLPTVARERFGKSNPASFWQVFLGAYLLFLSQGIHLVDYFYRPLEEGAVLGGGTYLLAQLLIVLGLRSHIIYSIAENIENRTS